MKTNKVTLNDFFSQTLVETEASKTSLLISMGDKLGMSEAGNFGDS